MISHRAFTLLLTVLIVSGSVAAIPSPREQPADTTPPVRVFQGETLDVSAVQLTGGGTVGSSSVTLVGVAGDAEGDIQTIDDPITADFSGFTTGTYSVSRDSDDRPEFVVTTPRVTKVVLRNQNGANVTNGWEPTGKNLTVTAQYNFERADRLDITVTGPDGLDVTNTVATVDRITTSGGTVRLNLSGETEGTYRITVTGSELTDASRTVTVRTGPRHTTTTSATPTTTKTPRETPTETTKPTPTETTEPTRTPTKTPTPATTTTTETPPPTTTTTGMPGSGFGPLTAVLALFARVGYALRRR